MHGRKTEANCQVDPKRVFEKFRNTLFTGSFIQKTAPSGAFNKRFIGGHSPVAMF